MGRGQGTSEGAAGAAALRRGAMDTSHEPPVCMGQLYNNDVSGMIGRLRADLHEFGNELLSELNGNLGPADTQALANELTNCLNEDQFSRFGQCVVELRSDHELSGKLADRYDELLG